PSRTGGLDGNGTPSGGNAVGDNKERAVAKLGRTVNLEVRRHSRVWSDRPGAVVEGPGVEYVVGSVVHDTDDRVIGLPVCIVAVIRALGQPVQLIACEVERTARGDAGRLLGDDGLPARREAGTVRLVDVHPRVIRRKRDDLARRQKKQVFLKG